MPCASSLDRRFPVQRISDERWRAATAANLAADHLAGYDLWVRAFIDSRPEWDQFAAFLSGSHPDELAGFVAQQRTSSLAFLVMMLTGACNADCPICFTDRRAKRGETTPAQRDTVLHQAAELGAEYVYVPGEGEPTIDRGWWQFLESCRDAGLQALVFTNGLIFSEPGTSRKYWGCEPAEAVDRLVDFPVSLYVKMWSTQPSLVGQMMRIEPGKYHFTDYDGECVPTGMVHLLERLPRERLGIEVVVERRNADEVVERIVPFAERNGLSQIIEVIQHNGRTLGNASYDPTDDQVRAVTEMLSPTSCSLATCKAVVTARGYLSPRIAILENQLPRPPRHVGDDELWTLLHSTDYLVQRRYERGCLCETEAVALAQAQHQLAGPTSIVPPSLVTEQSAADSQTGRRASGQPAGDPTPADPLPTDPTPTKATTYDLSTVAALLSDQVPHGGAVAVTGRALTRGPGLFELADGPSAVAVAGADTAEYAWVTVRGQWDAVARALRAESVDVIKQPQRRPVGSALPEYPAMRDPRLLTAIVDRSVIVNTARTWLLERGYLEVVTPMLRSASEMCLVSQAVTDRVAGRRFYLRTDPEEYLKRYLSAGVEAVFEVSTNVRDDESDETHLVEFQSLEYYRRAATFAESVELADELVRLLLAKTARGPIRWQANELALDRPFLRMPFAELYRATTGIDLADDKYRKADGLAAGLREAGLEVDVTGELVGWRRAYLEDSLGRHVAPRLRRPTWVTHFPADLALSACLDPADQRYALRAELYLPGGLELAHVYQNLVEGDELRARYDARRSHRVAAGLPYVPTNEGLMASAEAGMPPMAGGAIGLDRVLMVARGDDEIGRGLLFAREGLATVPALRSLCGTDGCGSGACGSGVCGASGCGHSSSGCGGGGR